MTRGLLTRSIYSPGNLTPEALEALFVGRDKMLDDVLKRLSNSLVGEEKHFILLVGPRGIGKTHFVALAHHRLTHDERYREAHGRAVIAYLSEEEWGVASFLDLLLRILSAIGERYEGRLEQAALDAIFETYQRDPQAAEQLAREELIRVVGDRTLLLICENLHDLFHGLGNEGQQRWRAFIQEHPFWTILATAPKLFSGVQSRTWPFYGFFTIRNLDTLDFEGALSLLRQRARFEGKKELVEFLDTPTGRARVRAIHHLAGGNHRIYVVMVEFLDHESLNELLDPFMGMVDDLTPYYQEKMRQLSPQQRKIVEFLAREQCPVIVKQIAVRCLMSPQTAAKQIGQLVEYGFVERQRDGRETYCELAEPLMRICIEIKDTRTKHLRLFVDFLRHWYSSRELRSRLDALRHESSVTRRLDLTHLSVALHECSRDNREPFLDALTEEEWRCWESGDYAGIAEASARLSAERGLRQDYYSWVYALRELHHHEDALRVALEAVSKYPDDAPLLAELAWAYADLRKYEESVAAIDRAIEQEPTFVPYRCFRGAFLLRMGSYEDVLRNEDELLELDSGHVHSIYTKALALVRLERYEEALPLVDAVAKERAEYHEMLLIKSTCLLHLRRYSECVGVCDELLSECTRHWEAYINKAEALHAMLLEDAAADCIMHLIDADEEELPVMLVGIRKLIEMHRFEEAREFVGRAVALNVANEEVRFLQVLVDSGAYGLMSGFKRVEDLLHERHEGLDVLIRDMLLLEVEVRGAVVMARQVARLHGLLERCDAGSLLIASFIMFISAHLATNGFRKPDWSLAMPVLVEAFGELQEFALVLEMLSVAIRYASSGDKAVLLELPGEKRLLFTQDAHLAGRH